MVRLAVVSALILTTFRPPQAATDADVEKVTRQKPTPPRRE